LFFFPLQIISSDGLCTKGKMNSIGLLNEKPLHASIKQWYAQPNDHFEVPLDGFVIDIVREDVLLEIQTKSFASLKTKIMKLTGTHRLRLIYPIAQEKWIVKLAENGSGKNTRRKSPKTGRVEDLFWELVSFPQLLTNPNFSLDVLLIREEEVRRYDEKRAWRKKGWVTEEHRLMEVLGHRLFEKQLDWRSLLPEALNDPFTTKDLAEALNIRIQLSQRMAYSLHKGNIIQLIGKAGRANLFRITNPQ
jgi:hypothetical protein